MAYKNWKAVEREHNRLFKCSGRVGPTGKDLPDSFSAVITVESKSMSVVPAWLAAALQQSSENAVVLAARNSEPNDQRLPIVAIHQTGDLYENDLVAMRLGDFVRRVLPALELQVKRDQIRANLHAAALSSENDEDDNDITD